MSACDLPWCQALFPGTSGISVDTIGKYPCPHGTYRLVADTDKRQVNRQANVYYRKSRAEWDFKQEGLTDTATSEQIPTGEGVNWTRSQGRVSK